MLRRGRKPTGRRRPMTWQPDQPAARATLRRLVGRLAALLGVSVLVGATWLLLQLPGALSGSERFRLQALEVGGLRVLTGAQILAASGLGAAENVFAVDLVAVARRIEALPWVRSATVMRRPPDRLRVDVVERRRVAWVSVGRVYGIDAEGVLLPPGKEERESLRDVDLPVISGLAAPGDSLRSGTMLADSTLTTLLDWWRRARAADGEFCMNVSEIQPLAPDNVRLRLVGDGLEVRLPVDRAAERIRVLKRVMERVYRECPDPAYIDLRFAGQVVVGTRDRRSG